MKLIFTFETSTRRNLEFKIYERFQHVMNQNMKKVMATKITKFRNVGLYDGKHSSQKLRFVK